MPKLVLDGDATGAVKATGQTTDGVAKLKAEFKAAAAEAAQLTREAKRIVDENATPQERYNSQVERLAKMFVAGKISVEQMDRAVGNYGKQLDESTKSHGKHKQAHEEAFGAESLKSLSSYVAGLVTVEKGIELVTEALREQAEEKRRAAENVAGGLAGADALVNSGNPAQAKAIAEQFMGAGLIGRDQQAAAFGVGGNIVTSGHANEAEFLKELAEKRIIQPLQAGELAQNITKVQSGFGAEAGSFEDIFKKVRVAANEKGVGASPADMARYLADLSDEARESGTPIDQVLAVMATETQKSKSLKSGEAAAKQYMTEGNVFDGEQLKAYGRNLSDIQGAPGQALPDQIPGLGLGAARGTEAAKARNQKVIEDKYANLQLLATGVWESRSAVANQAGGLHPLDESLYQHTVGALLPNRSVLDMEFTGGMRNVGEDTELGRGIEKYLGVPEGYWEKQQQLLEEQNNMMRRSDRNLPPPSGLQE